MNKETEYKLALSAFFMFKKNIEDELDRLKKIDTVCDFYINELVFIHDNGVKVTEKHGVVEIE